MIKILTGWSNPGGSTIAHINLCNLFNKNNLDCILLGPHQYHLDKCKAGILTNDLVLNKEDILIVHFLQLNKKFNCKKMIYSCHETNIMPIKNINQSIYDYIQFVSRSQYNWHQLSFNNNHIIIPNIVAKLNKSPLNTQTAGIIGSVDRHKQTHLSIERAINKGYKNILLFGVVTDQDYYNYSVKKYVDSKQIKLMGHYDDKQKMYDSIDEVFHSSQRETFNLIKAECYYTGTKYDGLPSTKTDAELWSETDILNAWEKIL